MSLCPPNEDKAGLFDGYVGCGCPAFRGETGGRAVCGIFLPAIRAAVVVVVRVVVDSGRKGLNNMEGTKEELLIFACE